MIKRWLCRLFRHPGHIRTVNGIGGMTGYCPRCHVYLTDTMKKKLLALLHVPGDLWKAFKQQILHLPGPRGGPTNPTLKEGK